VVEAPQTGAGPCQFAVSYRHVTEAPGDELILCDEAAHHNVDASCEVLFQFTND